MRTLELFSGAGGLARGLENCGFEHLAFVELNKDACATLRQNFNKSKVHNIDVKDFDFSRLKNIDLVAGGPPCQPFSLGGKHLANDDCRDMFPYAITGIQELKPKGFIFENVKGLLRQSFSEYFEYILTKLRFPELVEHTFSDWRSEYAYLKKNSFKASKNMYYYVTPKLVNAANYGVPQMRERVFIVGLRNDQQQSWQFPAATHSQDRLLWDQYVSGEYWDKHNLAQPKLTGMNEGMRRKIEKLKENFKLFPPQGKPWITVRDALKGVPEPQLSHDLRDHVFRDGAKCYPGHTGSILDWPAKTIKAGAHGVPGGENMLRFADESVRYLTVYEAKVLQTFPPDFDITGSWGEAMRQIGNAVPVQLAETIGMSMQEILSNKVCKLDAARPSDDLVLYRG